MKAKTKFSIIAIAVVTLTTTSCTQELKEKISSLKDSKHNDSIQALAYQEFLQDSLTAEFTKSMEDIRIEMDELIRDQASGILVESSKNGENRKTQVEMTKDRLGQLRTILDGNKNKIDNLIVTVQKYDAKNKDLLASLNRTKDQFEQTKIELAALEEVIASKNGDLKLVSDQLADILNQNDSLCQDLKRLDKKAFTGHYLVASADVLKEKGVVMKEGGIFKIGGIPVLNDEFASNEFAEVDIRETKQIPIDAEKFEIVTNHPQDSYEVVTNGEEYAYLEITDPEKFWRSSKYMVIQTK